MLTLLLFGYLGLTATVFVFVHFVQRMETVRYCDITWPPRWSHYRTALGDHHIATAVQLATSGQRRQALLVAQKGLAHSPANVRGRLLLAEWLAESGQSDRVRRVLLDGLEYHQHDPVFVAKLCSLLLRQGEDGDVIELAHRQLSASALRGKSTSVLVLAAAVASFVRGDCDSAEQFLKSLPALPTSRPGRLLAAKIERDRGYDDLALLLLRNLAAEFPDDREIQTEYASELRRCGRATQALRAILSFQIAHPTLPGPRLELFGAYRQSGDLERAHREADAFMREFAADATALAALAEVAANTGDVTLTRRLWEHSAIREASEGVHAILVVEALVVAGDFDGAVAAGETLLHNHPKPTADFTAIVSSLLALAHFGLHDEENGRRLLARYLDQTRLRPENLVALAQRLLGVDAVAPARLVLARAVAAEPRSQIALTRLLELDLNTDHFDDVPANLTRLLAMRRPSPEVLRVAQLKLGSDRFLFSPERPAVLPAVRQALEKSRPATSRE